MSDPSVDYSNLYPRERPGPEDVCSCDEAGPIMLTGFGGLADNPIRCVRCNREVPPERLGLDQGAVDAAAWWLVTYGAIDALELASASYELWAQGELMNPRSAANELAYETRAALDEFRRCYFSFWQPAGSDSDTCPLCGDALIPTEPSYAPQGVCEKDSIIMFIGRHTAF